MGDFKRYFIFIVVALTYSQMSLGIDHAKEIAAAQEWANSFERPYPIVIFNRDELHFRFLAEGASAETDTAEKKRQSIIGDHIFKKTGLQLASNILLNIETQLYVTPGGAVAMPFHESYDNNGPYQVCTVFVNAPNGNSQIEVERLTGLNVKEAYDGEHYAQLQLKEDFDVMYLFSLYHEVSHCLDQSFMPETYKTYSPTAHDVHASESFAETLAYLQISKRLGNDIAKARLLYRILYSRHVGTYLAQNVKLSFGDPLFASGGAIYYLAPSLSRAYQWLETGKVNPEKVDNDTLYQAAEAIVRESLLDFRSFSAIARSLVERNKIVTEYSTSSFNDPDLFFDAYQDLILYYATTDNWLKFGLDRTIENLTNHLQEAPHLPIQKFCKTLGEDNPDSFILVLDEYRNLLNSQAFSAESRYKRYLELNSLSKTLSGQCADTIESAATNFLGQNHQIHH